MLSLLWIILPYSAFLSFAVGHLWRYRRDRFHSYTARPDMDRTQRLGSTAFRIGFGIVVGARITDMIASGPHSRPEGSIYVVILIVEIIAGVAAMIGAALLFLPDLIASPARPAITRLDRITLPVLIAGLLSGVLIRFDPNSSDAGYRTAESLFAWFRSLFTLHPYPEAMRHAPLIYQARGLILLLLIAIWPYTRLAGIFAGPIIRLIPRARPELPRPFRARTAKD
ncbi:respiratory nitrate reductase subunit gamma [Nocardia sp. GCM10030253]|uniref:respiratory nitrate reductase subunit gamma n=1 Tax=Nocardia sp. GCM10030253 TaxID=3273404 RepID=UPI00363B2AC6